MALVLAGVLWGTSGTLQAFAPPGSSPLVIGEVRLAVGGFFLTAFTLLSHGPGAFAGKWPWGGIIVGALNMVCYQLCFFASILRTGVVVGTMVALGSAPVMGGFLAWVILGEALTLRWAVSTALAVAGCFALSLGGPVTVDPLGIGLALVCGFSFGLMGLVMKKIQAVLNPMASIALCMAAGALAASPVCLFAPVRWLISSRGITVALALGLLSTAVPYGLYSKALTVVPVSAACTLTLIEPLTASVLGVFLLGESLTFISLAGTVLILTGLIVLSLPGDKKTPPAQSRTLS